MEQTPPFASLHLLCECTCQGPGYCPRYNLGVHVAWWRRCQAKDKTVREMFTGMYRSQKPSEPSPNTRNDNCLYLGPVLNRMGQICPGKWLRSCSMKSECTVHRTAHANNCQDCSAYEPI
jgi:hypothetical protein